MQAIFETIFDVVYLIVIISTGITIILKSKGNKQYLLFGIMAVTLGAGDSFHLIPRAYALSTTGLDNFVIALGIGKFITSITMTIFYILLYYVWRFRYKVKDHHDLTLIMYSLAALRIVLCLFPQNEWTSVNAPLSWAVYRNLPFAAMGIIVIILYYSKSRHTSDYAFRFMWLTIVLSFAFYIPVVLLTDIIPAVGILMIPKTCAYVATVMIGFSEMKRNTERTAGA